MNNQDGHLQYPNLFACRVVLSASSGNFRPPVRLPQECRDAADDESTPQLYDFALERTVLQQKEDRESEMILLKASSREELQKATLIKMKSVTKADEGTCRELLEDSKYNLEQAIAAYFQSNQ